MAGMNPDSAPGRLKISLWLVLVVMITSGCGYHTTRETDALERVAKEVSMDDSRVSSVWVDQNGDFYHPDGRDDTDLLVGQRYKFCLRTGDHKKTYDFAERKAAVGEMIGKNIAKDVPVVILVHGFNNDLGEALPGYETLMVEIGKRDQRSEFILFFWDGLQTRGFGLFADDVQIWNNACGHSQMAGINGLRSLLKMLGQDRRVLIVAHSRGASVALSALSNPPFARKFSEATTLKHHGVTIKELAKEELISGDNIVIGMLAPAIGEIDFMKPEVDGRIDVFNRALYRDISCSQLIVGYRNDDRTLLKYVGVTGQFNATTIGTRPNSRKLIEEVYADSKMKIQWIKIDNGTKHGFSSYLAGSHASEFIDAITRDAVEGKGR